MQRTGRAVEIWLRKMIRLIGISIVEEVTAEGTIKDDSSDVPNSETSRRWHRRN